MISRRRVRDVTRMLGFRNKNKESNQHSDNRDVAKLFFDSFSGRVSIAETRVHEFSREIEKMRLMIERGQVSDLVLLERLQKIESFVRESLASVKETLERDYGSMPTTDQAKGTSEKPEVRIIAVEPVKGVTEREAAIASRIVSPTGQVGSLPSITTPTELQVLTLLAGEGPKSAPEIGRAVGRSREHTARLMRKLYEEGYVHRDQTRVPFRYSVVDRLKQTIRPVEAGAEAKEPISVRQP